MRTGTKRAPLLQEGDIAALDPKLARLMQICGIKELPPVHTRSVPLERIIVNNDAPVKSSARFIRSIALVGIRQPPSVAFVQGSSWEADDARYVVVMGRRRIVAALRLLEKGDQRFKAVKCEVYEWNAPRLSAFLALVENEQRSDGWIQDVIHLRQLIHEGVAMTLDDLTEYGFNRKSIRGRLDIALLPDAICDQICAGTVSLDVAMQITRLKVAERERLNALAQDGEVLSPELVKSLFKKQVDEGLSSVHANLSQIWTALPDPPEHDGAAPLSTSSIETTAASMPAQLAQLLALLRHIEVQEDPAMERLRPLIQVLIKEVEIVQHQCMSRQKGEKMHV
jgi:ParB-like chromosome segregation protein Spo0J